MNTHVGVATNGYPRHEMVSVIYLKADQLQLTRGSQFGRTHLRAALVYTRIEGGIEFIITRLFTNATFVLLLFIRVAMLCSVDLLC